MAEIIVVRLEQYPIDEPTGWAVGFNVICKNNRSFYIDTTISFDEAKTDEEAIEKALERLKETIQTKINELENKSPLLGTKITL